MTQNEPYNRHAPTIEKWPAGPNFGRPYLLKFWVFLAGKKCNELGKKCSIHMNLHRKHKRLCFESRFSSFRSFSANHFSNNQNQSESSTTIIAFAFWLLMNSWLRVDEEVGFLLQQSGIVLAHRSWTFAGFNPKGNVREFMNFELHNFFKLLKTEYKSNWSGFPNQYEKVIYFSWSTIAKKRYRL